MKKIILAAIIGSMTVSAMAEKLTTDDQKISYTIGTQIGNSLKGNVSGPIQLDEQLLFEGISDVLANKTLQLGQEEMTTIMQSFAKKAGEYAQQKAAEAAAKNQQEATKLLEENKKKDGVKVTDSGLQYRVIQQGKGEKPTATDIVKVHYKGTLADGSTFDSSYDRGQPAEFPLNAVIKGWTEGLQLMPAGSKYELVIPAELAYGSQGPGSIGPNRALIFEVELLEIKAPATKETKEEAPKEATEKQETPKS